MTVGRHLIVAPSKLVHRYPYQHRLEIILPARYSPPLARPVGIGSASKET
jgi:hypothetical protein